MSFSGPKPPSTGATGFPLPSGQPKTGNASSAIPVIPKKGERPPGKLIHERQPAVAVTVPPKMGGAKKAEVKQLTEAIEQSRDRLAVLEGQKFLCSQLENLSQQLNRPVATGAVNYRLVFVPKNKPPISVIPPETGGADVQAMVQKLRQQAKPFVEQAKAYFSEDNIQELDRQLTDIKSDVNQKFARLEELHVQPVMANVLPAPAVLDVNRLGRDLRPVLSQPPRNLSAMPDDDDFVLLPDPSTASATASMAAPGKTKTEQWLNFYHSGGRIDDQSHTLNQIRRMTPTQLEQEHRYIQLLFPNEHVSDSNPEAPRLTPEMVQQIRNSPALQKALQKSLDQMLEFWGVHRDG